MALKSELVEDATSQGQHIDTPGTPIGKKRKEGGGGEREREMEEGKERAKHKR